MYQEIEEFNDPLLELLRNDVTIAGEIIRYVVDRCQRRLDTELSQADGTNIPPEVSSLVIELLEMHSVLSQYEVETLNQLVLLVMRWNDERLAQTLSPTSENFVGLFEGSVQQRWFSDLVATRLDAIQEKWNKKTTRSHKLITRIEVTRLLNHIFHKTT